MKTQLKSIEMHYSTIAAPLVLAAGAMAHSNGTVYVTEVVSSFTTYCPYATTFSHGASTYTVTEVSPFPSQEKSNVLRARNPPPN